MFFCSPLSACLMLVQFSAEVQSFEFEQKHLVGIFQHIPFSWQKRGSFLWVESDQTGVHTPGLHVQFVDSFALFLPDLYCVLLGDFYQGVMWVRRRKQPSCRGCSAWHYRHTPVFLPAERMCVSHSWFVTRTPNFTLRLWAWGVWASVFCPPRLGALPCAQVPVMSTLSAPCSSCTLTEKHV